MRKSAAPSPRAPSEPARSIYGPPIVFGARKECLHDVRLLGVLIAVNGVHHVCSWCCRCGGRSQALGHRDLVALDLVAFPVIRDNRTAQAAA